MSYLEFPEKYKTVLKDLEDKILKLYIPKKDSRKMTAGYGRSIVFGLTKHRREIGLHPSVYTLKNPEIWGLLRIVGSLMKFDYTSVMLNRDFKCNPHVDNNKEGTLNMIYGFGDYEGGELIYDGKEYDIKNKWLVFDGHIEHSVKEFKGNRNTITFFSLK